MTATTARQSWHWVRALGHWQICKCHSNMKAAAVNTFTGFVHLNAVSWPTLTGVVLQCRLLGCSPACAKFDILCVFHLVSYDSLCSSVDGGHYSIDNSVF
jgi:hypothetical protein